MPYPVDYGGVVDLFYKITALHQQGIKIHLHCFEYGRGKQDELSKYCEEVFYYKRRRGLKAFSLGLPYIVSSRKNKELLANLLKDDYPVLLEGIHCTYYLYKNKLPGKKVLVRLHNVEFEYYSQLAKSTTSFFRKTYFLIESYLLKKYEEKVLSKAIFIAVSLKDAVVYEREFNATDIRFLPVFLPCTSINSKEGKGNYCLYHGNLSVAENEKAATWLLQHVFSKLSIPFVIAGKDPSEKLIRSLKTKTNICLVANPDESEMCDLISKAQINILPSMNATGIKLKLLNVLFNGRHAIVNDATVKGTGFGPACHVAGNASGFKSIVTQLYHRPFTEDETVLRNSLLQNVFDNKKNAERLIQWIW